VSAGRAAGNALLVVVAGLIAVGATGCNLSNESPPGRVVNRYVFKTSETLCVRPDAGGRRRCLDVNHKTYRACRVGTHWPDCKARRGGS
jgi:hypothetical protein